MAVSPEHDDDLEPEYDLRKLKGVVRGKYSERYREQVRVVRLDDDVVSAFPNAAAVNEALRIYLREHPTTQASA